VNAGYFFRYKGEKLVSINIEKEFSRFKKKEVTKDIDFENVTDLYDLENNIKLEITNFLSYKLEEVTKNNTSDKYAKKTLIQLSSVGDKLNELWGLINALKEKEIELDDLIIERTQLKKDINNFIKSIMVIVDQYDNINDFAKKIDNSSLLNSLYNVYDVITEQLNALGIEEIPALNKQFNAEYHNCIDIVPDSNQESGKIVQVLRKGYRFKNGKVLRFADVVSVK